MKVFLISSGVAIFALVSAAALYSPLMQPIAVSKSTITPLKPTTAQLAEYRAYEQAEASARISFAQGDISSARRFFEAQEQISEKRWQTVPKGGFHPRGSAPDSDFTIQLAACDLADGKPNEALSRYLTDVARRPGTIWDLAGRMFYAAELTGNQDKVERVIALLEEKTYADRNFFGYQDMEPWEPKDPRTLTLMHVAQQLAQDRNRSGFEAAIQLAEQASHGHPAVLRLHLGLLQTLQDSRTFRTLGLTVTDAEAKTIPSLDVYRRHAQALVAYERRYPQHWATVLAREQAVFQAEKEAAVRDTFAYEAPPYSRTSPLP